MILPATGAIADSARSGLHAAQQPLYFEENHGQTDEQVRFLARGAGGTLFLTPAAAVLKLHDVSGSRARGMPVLRMRLVGARPDPEIEGRRPEPARSHYYTGADRSRWLTDVPTYARVRYRSVYPGIDLEFYGRDGHLEYDFVVDPGVDPDVISLTFEGADAMRLDRSGNLLLETSGGEVMHHAPYTYQETADGGRRVVESRYEIQDGRVSFRLAHYDRSRPLVIDPALTYASYLGGSGADAGNAVAADTDGNMYVTGRTASTDFPGSGNTLASASDAFVSKFNATGDLVFSTYLGSNSTSYGETGNAIAVDGNGRIYITGQAATVASQPFPTTDNGCSFGVYDVFVAVLGGNGALEYSTCLGGDAGDAGHGVAVDQTGAIYVTGVTISPRPGSSDAFPLQGAFQSSNKGFYDAFVLKLANTGTNTYELAYSSYLGGAGNDSGNDIAVDAQGRAHMVGISESDDLAVTDASARSGASDMFFARIAADGGLDTLRYIGGSGSEGTASEGGGRNGIAVDAGGTVYLSGKTDSEDFSGAVNQKAAGIDGVVVGLNDGGMAFSRYLGGSSDDDARDIALGSDGDLFVTGMTASSDLEGSTDVPDNGYAGNGDAFMTRMGNDGEVRYSVYLGGANPDAGNAIAMDAAGSVYITGVTESGAFPVYPADAAQPALGSSNGGDAFIVRIGPYADVEITDVMADIVSQESAIEYTTIITNNGPDTATDIEVTHTLPAGASVQSDVEGATCSLPSFGNLTFSCALPSMGAGDSRNVVLRIGAVSGDYGVEVSAAEFDPVLSNNTNGSEPVPDGDLPSPLVIMEASSGDAAGPAGGGSGGGVIGLYTLLLAVVRLWRGVPYNPLKPLDLSGGMRP